MKENGRCLKERLGFCDGCRILSFIENRSDGSSSKLNQLASILCPPGVKIDSEKVKKMTSEKQVC